MATDALGIGGAETHIVTLARGLTEIGQSVTVLSSGGVYEAALAEYGIPHIKVPYRRLLSDPRVFLFLSGVLSRGDYDVVHAHTRKMAFLFHRILKKRALPLVTTAHWTFSTVFWKRIFTRWGKKTLAVSEDIRDYLTENYGLLQEDVTVTVNGIDGEKYRRSSAPYRPYETVTVTRLDTGRSKTVWALLAVFPRILQRFPKATLTVVGDGNEYAALVKKAEAVNRAVGRQAVRLVGASDDVLPYLDGAAVFVGASRAALEALATGCVTVLSGDEGYLSLFEESVARKAKRTNFCFRSEEGLSEDRLYGDLVRALSLPKEERGRLSSFARDFVLREYSVERMACDALSVYRRAREGMRPAVFLSGYYGYGNLGDDLSLSVAIRLLLARGNKDFFVPMPMKKRGKGEEYTGIPRYSPFALFRYMRRCDRLVFGGGTLIQNKTSRRSLFYYTSLMRLAKICGVPVEILAGGIGGVRGKQRNSIRKCLLNATLTLRTPLDIADLHSLLPEAKADLLSDLVFSLPIAEKEKKRSGIAVSLRGREVPTAFLNCLMRYGEKSGEKIFFFPMSPKDLFITRRAAEITGGKVYETKTADGLLSFLSSMRYAVGMRLHFLILALRTGCCPISLSYDEKGEKFASFVNDTLQKPLILTVDKNCDKDMERLYERLFLPPPTDLLKEADRRLSMYYQNEKSET